jgi:hypothetical protein
MFEKSPPTQFPLSDLYMGFLIPPLIDFHLEDGSCGVCRNAGKPSAFYAAYPRKPKKLHLLRAIHIFVIFKKDPFSYK